MNGFVLFSINGAQGLTRFAGPTDEGRHQVYIVDHIGDGSISLVQYVTAHEARRQAAEWARVAIECDHADLGVEAPLSTVDLVGPEPVT